MIFQGVFNILDLYFKGMDLFYNDVDKYFLDKITNHGKINPNKTNNLDKFLSRIILILTNEFVKLGLRRAKVKNRFSDKFLTIKVEEIDRIASIEALYEKKISPLVYEIVMEQIIFYLVDNRGEQIILNFKTKGLFTIEFILELRNLKNLFENSPEKLENLRRYIRIRDKIIIKFCTNKKKIESFEDLDNTHEKLQLLYLIYRIIDFFNIQNLFDFSPMIDFLKNHFDECLENIPFISLKNPDICYCALYLAKNLNVDFNKKKVKEFLLNLYDEQLAGFEFPIIEANNQLYFYFKSTSLAELWLTNEQIDEMIRLDPKLFEAQNLENLETSQLAVILKIFAFLELFNKIDKKKIKAIYEEIEKRITPLGIKQSRDGLYTSEATYYVIFSNYINYNSNIQKTHNLLENIVSRIYRNLEILNFLEDMNLDLLSELVYSIESLRLFNCINSEEMILSLVKHLFPVEVERKLLNSEKIKGSNVRSKHMMVNRITGETVYTI